MSGQIFISYRRDDSAASAGRLYDRLLSLFSKNQIFIDVDLDPGIDFVEAIETSVGSCDVLIAVIGKRWLLSSDQQGKRRLENPEDFVRLEIATALKRKIRVIPVLVDGASMPRSSDLPDDLKLLIRRNAIEVSHNRFNADWGRLVAALERVDAIRKRREEKDRVETERRQRVELMASLSSDARTLFTEVNQDPNHALFYDTGFALCTNGKRFGGNNISFIKWGDALHELEEKNLVSADATTKLRFKVTELGLEATSSISGV